MDFLCHFRLVFVACFVIRGWILEPTLADSSDMDPFRPAIRQLKLGQELKREKLAFRGGGECVYELLDLKDGHWYEVKISYPASTPARFSIDLLPEGSKDSLHIRGRHLLNTEKIVFHLDKKISSEEAPPTMNRKVLVSVEPEGFVAKPFLQEQAFVIYNIGSEEVVLGVPAQAYWVGFLGLLAIVASVLASQKVMAMVQLVQQSAIKCTKQSM